MSLGNAERIAEDFIYGVTVLVWPFVDEQGAPADAA